MDTLNFRIIWLFKIYYFKSVSLSFFLFNNLTWKLLFESTFGYLNLKKAVSLILALEILKCCMTAAIICFLTCCLEKTFPNRLWYGRTLCLLVAGKAKSETVILNGLFQMSDYPWSIRKQIWPKYLFKGAL